MATQSNKEAKEIIDTLNTGNFYCECPCGCGEEIALRDASLFYLDNFNPKAEESYKMLLEDLKERRTDLKKQEKNMTLKSQTAAKSANIGFILERIAPAFESFPFEHNDCRSLFDPIDYVIFEGLSKNGYVSKIIFTDIKTGAARLKSTQKEIKSLVQNKKVEFRIY
jgi:predicted Holliday junction resolvase-like endonuclease